MKAIIVLDIDEHEFVDQSNSTDLSSALESRLEDLQVMNNGIYVEDSVLTSDDDEIYGGIQEVLDE